MKKIFFAAMASTMLFATSCTESFDESRSTAGQQATVSVNIGIPTMQTRIYSDGLTAQKLQYAVYEKTTDGLVKTELGNLDDEIVLKKQIDFKLVTGRTYAFVFWAANEDAPYEVTFDSDGATMKYDTTELVANEETLDAFYVYQEYTVEGDGTMEAHLRRPFAQVNVGTNDYEDAKKANYTPTVSRITFSNVYTELDLVSGEVDGATTDVEYVYNNIPEGETFPIEGYDYMAMAYVLVPVDQELVEVQFDCSTAKQDGEARGEHTVGSVPVQRNYRTNIFGQLLTSNTEVNVIIEPEYYDPDFDIEHSNGDGYTYDAATNTYLVSSATGLKNVYAKTLPAGTNVKLVANIDLGGSATPWTPINNQSAIFDGDNHTVTGLYVDQTANGDADAGLFSTARGTVKNLVIVNPVVKGNFKVGALAGDGLCASIENVTVTGATVISTPWKKDGKVFDDGNNAGGIVGYLSAEPNGYVKNCTVENSVVIAYRKVGGIAGYAACYSNSEVKEITGCTVKNTQVIANMVETNYDGYATRQPDAGAIVGGLGTDYKADEADNTVENVTVVVLREENGTVDVEDAAGLKAMAVLVQNGTTFQGKTFTLTEDVDLKGEEWTPIGSTSTAFRGSFDGGSKTISNIKISSGNYVGLFGYTYGGKISNIKVNGADVKGRLGVAVIAGHPYTTNFENIEVTGKVTVEGSFYVATVGGGNNAYGNFKDITVNVEQGSYVKANSVENGTTYATYAGGVIGHPGEGRYTYENITSNIDVTGSSCYVGGIIGLAHYGSTFKNCSSSGKVSLLNALNKADGATVGGIAGCWHAGGADVTFENCSFTGTLSSNQFTAEELAGYSIVGNVWGNGGNGKLWIDSADATSEHNTKY